MTLWMLRLPLDPSALARYAAERGWMHRRGHDEGRALHHLLTETFGKTADAVPKSAFQPFRLLPGRKGGSLYGYSTVAPEALRDMAQAIAPPEALALLPLSGLQAKPMPQVWRAGQVLGFDLRVRPVVRLNSAIPPDADPRGRGFRKGAEIDAHVAAQARSAAPVLRDQVYLDWLAARLSPAADLIRETTLLHRFQRSQTLRQSLSEGPDAVFHGTLRITDPDGFALLLSRGVGRHCAYGFGMLLLRAPQSPPLGG
ncbi:type I-E CRISPR-associated protein Cas6/Cse3/CasE [uncultured Paracoccus sp.]|uniref:type I-E CRISPR-associated protein Cas6/Cse3/CasE n=1 Tax=uncultured Paracoccus sp. TaxID=189685 RepID=UPI0025D96124|nr:type I-E CRISPR-associated protein Cas6/Cse3/CasE [uncultured Paracoccus sp.]